MTCRKTTYWRALTAAMILSGQSASAVRADQIITPDQSFTRTRIIDFDEGRVFFNTADGRLVDVWIDDVQRLVIDRSGAFEDFNEAERLLANGEPDKATVRFRRAARTLLTDFWAHLLQARLSVAYDRAGEIDEAVMAWLRVLTSPAGAPSAARLVPRAIPDRRDGRTHRALSQTEAALVKNPTDAQRALLMLLRFEIFRRTGDKSVPAEAPRVAVLPIPEPIRTEAVYGLLHSALEAAFDQSVNEPLLDALDRAILHAPDAQVAQFLLLKGRLLMRTAQTREDRIRAGWAFMRIVAHTPDDPRAGVALYEAAGVLEKIGRPEQARVLVEECINHADVDASTRARASAMLERLSSEKGSPG